MIAIPIQSWSKLYDRVAWVWYVCGAGAFVLLVLLRTGPEAFVGFVGFLAFVALGVTFRLLGRRRRSLEGAFRNRFKFEIPLDSGRRTILQSWVNGTLQNLAQEFERTCKEEEGFLEAQSRVVIAKEEKTVAGLLSDLDESRKNIANAKAEFWSAHAVARRAGFVTWRKHAEYLALR